MGTSSPEGGRMRIAVGVGFIAVGLSAIVGGGTDTVIQGFHDQMAQLNLNEMNAGVVPQTLNGLRLGRNLSGLVLGEAFTWTGGVIVYKARRRSLASENPPAEKV